MFYPFCGGQDLGKIRRMVKYRRKIYQKELSIGESYRRTAGLDLAGSLVLVLSHLHANARRALSLP